MVLGLTSEFSKLSLATAIMVLTPVSCYYMTSFNYGGKKARGVGLTCRCHLSNIMPDSIFYDSMGWGIACLLFSLRVIATVFFSTKKWIQLCYYYNTNGLGKNLSYNGLRQMGLISLQWGTNSGGFQGCDFVEGFLCSCMLRCFKPGMLRDLSIQPTW